MLGEAHDRRAAAGPEVGERRQLAVLGLLDVGSTGHPCGQRSGSEAFGIRSIMSSVNVSPSSSACSCDSAARVAHEVGEQALDQPVLADDPLRALAARPA